MHDRPFIGPSAGNPSRAATGWQIEFEASGSQLVMHDDVLYAGSADGAVYAFDPTTGQAKWRFQTGEDLSSGTPVITILRGADPMASLGSGDVQARIGKGAFAPLGVRQVLIDAIASEVR